MRRLTTLLIAIISCATLYAEQPYIAYCTITTLHDATSRVEVDYGQEDLTKNYLVDEEGKALKYHSTAIAANTLSKLGWVYEDSYVVGEDNIRCVWVMSKLVTDDSQITEGFMTRKMYEDGDERPLK